MKWTQMDPTKGPGKSGRNSQIEFSDEGSYYLLEARLPGVELEDIDITLQGNYLTLKGIQEQESVEESSSEFRNEITYGNFLSTVVLSEDVDVEGIEAIYEDGTLKIIIPKSFGQDFYIVQ